MLGIALGIAALIVVLSVMNGFQKEVRSKIIGVTSHVEVNGYESGLSDWANVMAASLKHAEITGAAPFVKGQGMLAVGQSNRGVFVRGIDPATEGKVAELGRDMVRGKLDDLQPGEYGMILGTELARALQVKQGARVQLLVPQGNVTPAGVVPRMRSFTVTGIFSSGHYEYDMNLALIHIKDAQVLFKLDDRVSGIRLKAKDLNRAPAIATELARSLSFEGYVTDWSEQNRTYFRAVQIEKRMMFIILTLIIAVAAFNLVSTLVMVVTDKHPDIAILRTLGASPATIMRIFMVQGAVIGLIGTLAGVATGVVLALNVSVIVSTVERWFGVQMMSRELYFLTELPSDLHWDDVWFIATIACAMAFVATLYPSWRASKVNPAEALRYE